MAGNMFSFENSPSRRLSILQVVGETFQFLWCHRLRVARAIGIPMLLLLAVGLLSERLFMENLPSYQKIAGACIYALLFAWIGVSTHQLILTPGAQERSSPRPTLAAGRLFRYSIWSSVLFLCLFAMGLAIGVLLAKVASSFFHFFGIPKPSISEQSALWALSLAGLLASYFPARLCLILPTIGLGRAEGVKWSWARTKDNGWRVALLAYVTPWTSYIALAVVLPPGAASLESAVGNMLLPVLALIEVSLLSFTYKALTARPYQ